MTDHEDQPTDAAEGTGADDSITPDEPMAADDRTDTDTDGDALPAPPDGGGDDALGMPRDKAIRIAQIGLVVLALLVVGIVLLTKGGDDKDTSSKDDKASTSQDANGDKPSGKAQWPRNVGGRPPALGKRGQPARDVTLGKDAKPGVYLWNDYDGWHLWVVNGSGVPAVKGTITSNDAVAKAEPAVPDAGSVVVDDKVVTFDLPTDQPIVGVDFNPGFFAKNLVFTVEGPDGPVSEQLVHVGAKAEQAPYPLVLTKAAS